MIVPEAHTTLTREMLYLLQLYLHIHKSFMPCLARGINLGACKLQRLALIACHSSFNIPAEYCLLGTVKNLSKAQIFLPNLKYIAAWVPNVHTWKKGWPCPVRIPNMGTPQLGTQVGVPSTLSAQRHLHLSSDVISENPTNLGPAAMLLLVLVVLSAQILLRCWVPAGEQSSHTNTLHLTYPLF